MSSPPFEFTIPRVSNYILSDFEEDNGGSSSFYSRPPINEFDDEFEVDHGEESEVEDKKMDDAIKEKNAETAYQNTHPDKEQRLSGGREISEHEAIWSVSSFRPNWGPDKLRDNNPSTYWQSDCSNLRLEHTIDIAFHQATLIRQVSFFIDCDQDDSYAPKLVSIRGGTTYRDLQELRQVETNKMVGWVNVDITGINDGNPLRVFRLQIAILATHQNGRDTHIRQVKVYSVLPSFSKDSIPIQRTINQHTKENTIR